MFNNYNEHTYSFAVIGLSKKLDKLFSSRQAANEYMYSICQKYGIQIKTVWEDNHDKTYICDNGITFYIQRAM